VAEAAERHASGLRHAAEARECDGDQGQGGSFGLHSGRFRSGADRKILQAAGAVDADASGAQSPDRHGNLGGPIAAECPLLARLEQLAGWERKGFCFGVRHAGPQVRIRCISWYRGSQGGGRTRNEKFAARWLFQRHKQCWLRLWKG